MTNEQAKKMLKAKLGRLKRETSGTDFDCKYRYIDEVHGPSCELDTGDPYATGRNADEDNWFCADAERRTNA